MGKGEHQLAFVASLLLNCPVHTLAELAGYVDGQVSGDAKLAISGIGPFESAGPGELTLAVKKTFLKDLGKTRASAVIVPAGTRSPTKSLLQVENPRLAFARLLQIFHQKPFQAKGISPQASIGENCRISQEVTIEPFVRIGDGVTIEAEVTLHSGVSVASACRIGSGSTLYSNVVLYSGVELGRRVILHAGTVIGADGFGYERDGLEQVKIPQTGTVTLGDDVEIGANSCVDRGTFGATRIESGVKLDNHVHVGHNTRIGRNTVVVGQVGISGSCDIGENCVLTGHVGVIDHIRIGDRVTVMVKSAVTRDVPADLVVSGQPAGDHRRQLKLQAVIQRLPEMYKEIEELKRRLENQGLQD